MNRTQYGLMLVLSVCAAFIGGGMSSRALLTAEAFQARKAAPKANVVIVPAEGLIFKTPAGKIIARLDEGESGGRFGVYNNTGKGAVALGVGADGGGVAIYNNEGQPMGSIAASQKGGVMGLFNKDGKVLHEEP